ncbi:hypothetical protein SeMB42_g05690 [Synchytrium endobioticum]|uniref:Uncharacterized protein n=1 Tax=Synchytrium endobioticum TaxID=286115 RepID=A0A507CPY1_9FUNG|nr:hypothetical protein SeMB42_g05690 [Synchytrium endobioticum]TPX42767.1 hypothetical protein SeLEV6574_g05420 [Synchytrium endobioticum]
MRPNKRRKADTAYAHNQSHLRPQYNKNSTRSNYGNNQAQPSPPSHPTAMTDPTLLPSRRVDSYRPEHRPELAAPTVLGSGSSSNTSTGGCFSDNPLDAGKLELMIEGLIKQNGDIRKHTTDLKQQLTDFRNQQQRIQRENEDRFGKLEADLAALRRQQVASSTIRHSTPAASPGMPPSTPALSTQSSRLHTRWHTSPPPPSSPVAAPSVEAVPGLNVVLPGNIRNAPRSGNNGDEGPSSGHTNRPTQSVSAAIEEGLTIEGDDFHDSARSQQPRSTAAPGSSVLMKPHIGKHAFADLLLKLVLEKNFFLDLTVATSVYEEFSLEAFGSRRGYLDNCIDPRTTIAHARSSMKKLLIQRLPHVVNLKNGNLTDHCDALVEKGYHIHHPSKRYSSQVLGRALTILFRGNDNYSQKWNWRGYSLNAVAFTISLLDWCCRNSGNLDNRLISVDHKENYQIVMNKLLKYQSRHPDTFAQTLADMFEYGNEADKSKKVSVFKRRRSELNEGGGKWKSRQGGEDAMDLIVLDDEE